MAHFERKSGFVLNRIVAQLSRTGGSMCPRIFKLNSFDVCAVWGVLYSNGKYSVELRANHGFMENDFISAGEVILRSMDGSDDYFGPNYDESSQYYRFEENSGFNTSVSLILGYSF